MNECKFYLRYVFLETDYLDNGKVESMGYSYPKDIVPSKSIMFESKDEATSLMISIMIKYNKFKNHKFGDFEFRYTGNYCSTSLNNRTIIEGFTYPIVDKGNEAYYRGYIIRRSGNNALRIAEIIYGEEFKWETIELIKPSSYMTEESCNRIINEQWFEQALDQIDDNELEKIF